MKISLNWLQDFVDVSAFKSKPELLAAKLTAAGLEVEEIENKSAQFDNVVVGLILKKDKHPNAEKLTLCEVTTGEGVIHQIVCGAKNHNVDDKVVVALPGAILPGNFAIQLSSIRGIESSGMLCSQKELGLETTHEGLLILPQDAKVGQRFSEYMGFDDVVFELKVTPNRADCLSHFGLAREIACLLGISVQAPQAQVKTSSSSTRAQIALEVLAEDGCPRYTGRVITGVRVGPSPLWIKKRLESVGLSSINNVVDVTNYVMLELGQPLHAFDLRSLEGRKIVVGPAVAGETFQTFDGTKLEFKGDELVIRDGVKPVALAGVVGGLNSGIKDDTTDVFLECAYFSPMAVRRSARRFGIQTDSAYRFSRGVDPSHTLYNLDRATHLLLEVAGGEALSESYDTHPEPVVKPAIALTAQTVVQRLGYDIEASKIKFYLESIGCQLESKDAKAWQVRPPAFRFDLDHEMDLVEEVARLHGYEHIPERISPMMELPSHHHPLYLQKKLAVESLVGQGYFEAVNFAFVSESEQLGFLGRLDLFLNFGLKVALQPVRPMNPLNESVNSMRVSLLPSLMANMRHNFHHGTHEGRFFEIAPTFSSKGDEFEELWRLGLAAWGKSHSMWVKDRSALVFEVMGALEGLFLRLGVSDFQFENIKDKGQVPLFLHPGQAAQVLVGGEPLGFVGTLHPKWQEEWKVRSEVAIAELDFEKVFEKRTALRGIQTPSALQQVERDLAFLMPIPLSVGTVLRKIKEVAGANLASVTVFDLFVGGNLEKGQKSVAFRLIYQPKTQTLTETEINDMQNSVIEELKRQFSISMR